MRLRELDGHFVGGWHGKDAEHEYEGYRHVESIDEAQGVQFQCPKCAEGKPRSEDGKVMGAHYVLCWFANPRHAPTVPNDINPGPGRWFISEGSTSLDDLTFCGPGQCSVKLIGGCEWHGYVTAGGTHEC